MKTKSLLIYSVLGISLITISLIFFNSCKKDEEESSNDDPPSNPELILLQPTEMEVTDISITNKKISWSFNYTNIDGFKIDRKINDNEWETAYLSSSKDQYFVIDESVIPDSSLNYHYRVYAWSGSSVSLFAQLETRFSIPPPLNFNIEKVSDVINKLTWKDQVNGEMGFKIDRKISNDAWEIGCKSVGPDVEELYDTLGNKLHGEIQYRIYAYWNEFTSEKINQYTSGLEAPTNLQITILNWNKNKLSWNDNSNGEEGYKIDRKIEGQDWETGYGNVGENTTSFTDFNSPTNNLIEYRVYAYSGSLNSTYIQESVNTGIPAPSNLLINMNSLDQIDIEWKDNTTWESNYRIDRKIGSASWEANYAELPANTETYTDEYFPLNSTVYYRVYATVNVYSSNPAEGLVSTNIPAPSSLELVNPGDMTVSLTWVDNCDGEQGYKIDRRVGSDSWVENYAELPENSCEYTDEDNFINGETYYYRVYAFKDSYNSSYASAQVDMFICGNDMVDPRDGRTYATTQIGDQCWMADNLRYLHPWGAWCYDNMGSNCNTYGRLYEGAYAPIDPRCPPGWHVSTKADWDELIDYCGGSSIAGRKLKSRTGWPSGSNGSDIYGFGGLPGGYWDWWAEVYVMIEYRGYYWTKTQHGGSGFYSIYLTTDDYLVVTDNATDDRLSVRCVKDSE